MKDPEPGRELVARSPRSSLDNPCPFFPVLAPAAAHVDANAAPHMLGEQITEHEANIGTWTAEGENATKVHG